MRKMCVFRAPVSAILLALCIVPAAAHAANVTVGCPGGSGGTYPNISSALLAIGQEGPSTITVTGTCNENVTLNNARSITIAAPAPGGATIVGPLDTNSFDISLSQDILLQNLEIRGTPSSNGGGAGVFITDASEVHIVGCDIHDNQAVGVNADTGSIVFLDGTTIHNNTPNDGLDVTDNSSADVIRTTIQNNGTPNGGVGVFVENSSIVVFRQTNLIQNNADIGIWARNLSSVRLQTGFPARITTIQGHNANGILVGGQSHLQIPAVGRHVIQANGAACPLDPTCGGILASGDSTINLNNGVITGNQGSGISVQQGSNARLTNVTVSNNSGDGVHIQRISIGNVVSGNSITGNGGASVFCDERSLVIGDLSAFSNVRCEEIERSNGVQHGHEDKDKESDR